MRVSGRATGEGRAASCQQLPASVSLCTLTCDLRSRDVVYAFCRRLVWAEEKASGALSCWHTCWWDGRWKSPSAPERFSECSLRAPEETGLLLSPPVHTSTQCSPLQTTISQTGIHAYHIFFHRPRSAVSINSINTSVACFLYCGQYTVVPSSGAPE